MEVPLIELIQSILWQLLLGLVFLIAAAAITFLTVPRQKLVIAILSLVGIGILLLIIGISIGVVIATQPPPITSTVTEVFAYPSSTGSSFVWHSSNGKISAKLAKECARTGAYGLLVKYELSDEVDYAGWGVSWSQRPEAFTNLKAFGSDRLKFWAKSITGPGTLLVGMKDRNLNEPKIEKTVLSDEWTPIDLPFADNFSDVVVDSIENISIGFDGKYRAGSLCIDDIAFQSSQ